MLRQKIAKWLYPQIFEYNKALWKDNNLLVKEIIAFSDKCADISTWYWLKTEKQQQKHKSLIKNIKTVTSIPFISEVVRAKSRYNNWTENSDICAKCNGYSAKMIFSGTLREFAAKIIYPQCIKDNISLIAANKRLIKINNSLSDSLYGILKWYAVKTVKQRLRYRKIVDGISSCLLDFGSKKIC